MIQIKRVYEPQARGDGKRFFVERLWPRGIKKDELDAQAWLKELAPSPELRQWYAHDPTRWSSFKRKYFRELDLKPELVQPLLRAGRRGNVTLLYSARDVKHNSALALKAYLEEKPAK